MTSSEPSSIVPVVTMPYANVICSSPRLVRSPMQTVTEFTLSMLYLDSSSITASTMPVTTDTSCMGTVSWEVSLIFTPRGPKVTAVHLRPRTSAPWSHHLETGHLSQ